MRADRLPMSRWWPAAWASTSRIGPLFLRPGPGFGGSCFPKDTRAMVSMARDAGRPGRDRRGNPACQPPDPGTDARARSSRCSAIPKGRTVALLGLSFKPDTDDIRESPALFVLDQLLSRGADVRVYDPAAMENARRIRPEALYCSDQYEAAEGADLLVILTEWNQFRALEFDRLRRLLREPQVVDLRNLYEPERVAAAGLRYASLGRADAVPGSARQEAAADHAGAPPATNQAVAGFRTEVS